MVQGKEDFRLLKIYANDVRKEEKLLRFFHKAQMKTVWIFNNACRFKGVYLFPVNYLETQVISINKCVGCLVFPTLTVCNAFTPLKTKNIPNLIKRLNSYRTVNISLLGYTNKSFEIVLGQKGCSFRNPYQHITL